MRKQKHSRLSVPELHQKRIALDTLRMSDVGASIMGGMTKDQAREFLLQHGYTNVRIVSIEKGKGHG